MGICYVYVITTWATRAHFSFCGIQIKIGSLSPLAESSVMRSLSLPIDFISMQVQSAAVWDV